MSAFGIPPSWIQDAWPEIGILNVTDLSKITIRDIVEQEIEKERESLAALIELASSASSRDIQEFAVNLAKLIRKSEYAECKGD